MVVNFPGGKPVSPGSASGLPSFIKIHRIQIHGLSQNIFRTGANLFHQYLLLGHGDHLFARLLSAAVIHQCQTAAANLRGCHRQQFDQLPELLRILCLHRQLIIAGKSPEHIHIDFGADTQSDFQPMLEPFILFESLKPLLPVIVG